MGRIRIGFGAVLIWAALFSTRLAAQGQPAPNLPTDPASWVNSGPVTSEMLKGKAAFVYYYEEGCPRCRERWPLMLETAKKFSDKPIVFIAVNSGTGREDVAAYARDVKLTWPILVDQNRKFEQESGVGEISLQNIYQVRIITPDGKLGVGDFNNLEATAERALQGAKWNIDPTGIPPQLLPVWRGLEFGVLSGGGPVLKAALADRNSEIKTAAEKLNGLLQEKIAADLATAKQAYAAGEKWKSYKMVDALTTQYAGFELPEAVGKAKTGLAADETVKAELLAQRELDALKKRARTASPAALRGLLLKLKELSERHAATEAGAEAKELFSQAKPN